jgi:hypothetical protein
MNTSAFVFDAKGPLTLAEVRTNLIAQMAMAPDGAWTDFVLREVEERAHAAGDPDTFDPTVVAFLPVDN